MVDRASVTQLRGVLRRSHFLVPWTLAGFPAHEGGVYKQGHTQEWG